MPDPLSTDDIAARLDALDAKIDSIANAVTTAIEGLKPIVSSLQGSPILKMLGG